MRLFKPKYQKDKWYALFPVALEELRKEGYGKLLNVSEEILYERT